MTLGRIDAAGDQSTAPGTSDFVIDGVAVQGMHAFAGKLTDGYTYRYRAQDATNTIWEVGQGVWTASSSTLTRATIYQSSNGGAKSNFTAICAVVVTITAADFVLTASDVGLGSVTNDAQTKAAIVPNTVPSAGQLLIGNAGGTAYAPVSSSGDVTVSSAGVFTIANAAVTLAKIANAAASSKLVGSGASGSGAAYSEITLGSNLSMSGTTLNASGGAGTVTATGGSLTSNAVVLGAGTTDTKVVAGIISDGTSKFTLGVAGTSVGAVAFNNATSGSITIQPTTGALGSKTLTLPALTDTLAVIGTDNSFTVGQTITPAANTSALTVGTHTQTTSNPVLNLVQTWNAAGVTFTGLKLNITSTASASGSLLMDLQVASASQFSVDKSGNATSGTTTGTAVGSSSAVTIGVGAANNGFASKSGNNGIHTYIAGTAIHFMDTTDDRVTSTRIRGWSSGSSLNTAMDTAFSRNAANVVEVNTGTAGTYADIIARRHFTAPSSANGQALGLKCLTELTTIAAAATTDTAIQMPANSIVLGVSVRVTTAITCTSTFTVGDSGSATRFGSGLSKAVNTTNAGTVAPYVNASALSVRITPDSTPSDATGRVRVTIYYFEATVPTS